MPQENFTIQLPCKLTEEFKISGIAAIPRVSINGRLYLPEDLAKNDGVTTPLLWRHEGTPNSLTEQIPQDAIIGKITYHFDPKTLQLLYEAQVSDEYKSRVSEQLGLSIGGFYNAQHVCGSQFCYEVARDLRIVEGSLVPNPGMPETTVKITESAPACKQCDANVRAGLQSPPVSSVNAVYAEHLHKMSEAAAAANANSKETTTTTTTQAPAAVAKEAIATAPAAASSGNNIVMSEGQLTKLLAGFAEQFKNSQQVQLDKLTEAIGALKVLPKEQAAEPAAPVSNAQAAKTNEAEAERKRVAAWFSAARLPNKAVESGIMWTVDKNDWLKRFGYPVEQDGSYRKAREDITYSAPPQGFVRKAIFLPGGRLKVPVRQYTDFVELNGEDRANWYTIGAVDFAAGTEGSNPFVSASSQTITQKTATPSIQGAFQKVKYSQIDDQPFDLIGTVNMTYALAGLDAEATDLLSTVYDAVSVTNWVRADTGAAISTDDIASVTFKREGLLHAKRLIAAQGYDTSPGNLVLFMHPKQYTELLLDTNLATYYQYANPGVTGTGMLEQIYGVDIVVADQVKAASNTTNAAYRAVMAVKGQAFGMASARDITMEASRRNELQQIYLTGTQRVKSVVLDETATCRISSGQ